jgi:FkbM family methyltransferase
MKRTLQLSLLRLYRWVSASGIFSTKGGRAFFDWVYDYYKRFFEVGDIHALASLIMPGSMVIDVGANIGFFTRRFADWVGDDGKVIAIEPEEINFRQLGRMISQRGLSHRVEAIQAVAAESDGKMKLEVNPLHPADHRISEQGIEVQALRLDTLLAERKWRFVSFIKIDVQGAEERVLNGAHEILGRFRPALLMELDDEALREMRTSAERVLDKLNRLGYQPHLLTRGRLSSVQTKVAALSLCQDGGYADFLFLHQKNNAHVSWLEHQ